MLREPSKVNQIADAVLYYVKKIGKAKDESQWLTDPRQCKRMFVIGDITGGLRPLLAVQVMNVESTPKGPAYHDGKVTIGVHIVVDGDPNSESLLNDVASDVIRAISLNETLGGDEVGKPLAQSTYFVSYQPQYDVMLRTGFAVSTVTFEVTYEWAHTAP